MIFSSSCSLFDDMARTSVPKNRVNSSLTSSGLSSISVWKTGILLNWFDNWQDSPLVPGFLWANTWHWGSFRWWFFMMKSYHESSSLSWLGWSGLYTNTAPLASRAIAGQHDSNFLSPLQSHISTSTFLHPLGEVSNSSILKKIFLIVKLTTLLL